MAHERVSYNALAFGDDSLETVMGHFKELAPKRVSFMSFQVAGEALPKAQKLLEGTGYKVETFTHPFGTAPLTDRDSWEASRKRLSDAIQASRTLGGSSIYLLTGGRGALSWEEAAEAFAEAIAPCRDEAKTAGVKLLVEPAGPPYVDFHIAHNLRDTVLLAEIADIGVCMDIAPSWMEAGLKETIARAAPRLHLIQVGDYILGDRCVPCRAVVGDGVVPMKRLFGWILDAGYKGAFDLEMIGPRIDQIGRVESLRRSGDKTGEILQELGA